MNLVNFSISVEQQKEENDNDMNPSLIFVFGCFTRHELHVLWMQNILHIKPISI